MSDIRFLVLAAVLGGLVAAALTLAAGRLVLSPPRPVATVDLAGVLESKVQRLKSQGGDAAQIQRAAKRWGQRLDASVRAMAEEYGITLVIREAVVAGAPDLTEELYRRMVESAVGESDRRDRRLEGRMDKETRRALEFADEYGAKVR